MKINKKIVVIFALLLLVMSDGLALYKPNTIRTIRSAQKHAARTTIIPTRKTRQYSRTSVGRRVQGRMLATRGIQLGRTFKVAPKNPANKHNKTVQEPIAQMNSTSVKDTEQKVSTPTSQDTVEKVEQKVEHPIKVVDNNEQKKNQPPKASEIKPINSVQRQNHTQAPVQRKPVEQKINVTEKLPATMQKNTIQPMPLTENASVNQQEKSEVINTEQNNREQLIEMPDSPEKFKEFMEDLHKLPSAQRLAIIDKLAMPDEQKEQFKQIVAQMPAAVDEVTKDLQDPNSQAGKALQGKGWIEWFREKASYSWVKTASYYGRKTWDNTGGKLLKLFGYETKEVTDFILGEACWEFIFRLYGIKPTAGEILDDVLLNVLVNCFPSENSWANTIAKTTFAIGYYGALRGYGSAFIQWKVTEAFICTAYCKYSAKENADFMKSSVLGGCIDFFAHYMPACLKDGWMSTIFNKLTVPLRPIFTLSTLGAQLATIMKPTTHGGIK